MALNPADRAFSDGDLRRMFGGEMPRRESLAFYLDANLMAEALAADIRDFGFPAITAANRDLALEVSDYAVLSDARTLGCVLVTRDRGFELIHIRLGRLSGVSHAGIMIFAGRLDVEEVSDRLLWLAEKSVDYPISYQNQLLKFGFK